MISKGKDKSVPDSGDSTLTHAEDAMTYVPANSDAQGAIVWEKNSKVLEWLARVAEPGLAFEALGIPLNPREKTPVEQTAGVSLSDDWQMITNLCGYTARDFMSAGASLPLTVAEAEHFRRNHRSADNNVSRDFLAARIDLPSPLAELYGLYLYRASLDAESALFVAQTTNSTRVAHVMADLLAIGGFENGMECISYLGLTYSVPAAFDTSSVIDCANFEASRRMALSAEHPSHLLKLTPDEIGVLAANIVEKNVLSPTDFLDKSNLLAEARQDVNRLSASQHFVTAIVERDLSVQLPWVTRICAAYMRLLERWVADLPEVNPALH